MFIIILKIGIPKIYTYVKPHTSSRQDYVFILMNLLDLNF